MKRRTLKRVCAITLAGVLAAGTAVTALADVYYEAPEQGMDTDETYVTASAYAASTVLTQILGLELTSSNGAGIYNSGGSSSTYGTDSSNLGIFGSDINDVPDAYLYNYFYNLYNTQSGGGDYSVDDYADWTATPYVLRWDSNKQGPQGQASGSTTITINGVTKTCNPVFYYEPDIIIGAESGYSSELESYQSTYNEDYDPTIISAVSSSGTRSDGLGLQYNMFEMSANLVEIGAAVEEVEEEEGKVTRYEAAGYESAYVTAVNYDKYNRGLYYYAQSAFDSGELTEINYASSVSYDADTGWAITQGTGRQAQYANGIGNDIYDLLEDGYTFSDGTVVELTTTESSSDSSSGGGGMGGMGGGQSGGSSTTSAYYLTTDQMIEILTVTGEDGTEYGGVILGSQGSDDAYTELADAGISFLNNLPNCVYGITMQTTENGMGIAFYLSYFYYNQNEALNPVSIMSYWVEHFYHVSDTDAMQTVITNMLSDSDLNSAYEGGEELNIDEYDEAAIEDLMVEGIVYYINVEEPALEAAGTDSSSTAYWTSLDNTVGVVASECDLNGHSYEATVIDPDCTNKGYTSYTCSVCGDTYIDEDSYTDATGHSYVAVVTEPTETEQGYTTYTCSVCGDTYVADFTEATGSTSTGGGTTVTPGTTTTTLASQTITAKKTTTKKIKATKLKKKKATFKISASTSGNGKITFAKKSGSAKLKISKSGKVTVKKGTYKKGKTLKMKVTVTAAATSTYAEVTKTITVKVKIK